MQLWINVQNIFKKNNFNYAPGQEFQIVQVQKVKVVISKNDTGLDN